MKKIILPFFVLFSILASAHKSEISILKVVLNDSIFANQMSSYGKIDSVAFALFEKSGVYSYNHGEITFEEYHSNESPHVGIIRKMKSKETKAIVKIYFMENNAYYTKVKLRRCDANQPWLIYSRLMYSPYHLPKSHSRIFHYSYNWIYPVNDESQSALFSKGFAIPPNNFKTGGILMRRIIDPKSKVLITATETESWDCDCSIPTPANKPVSRVAIFRWVFRRELCQCFRQLC